MTSSRTPSSASAWSSHLRGAAAASTPRPSTVNGTRGTAVDYGCSERVAGTDDWVAASARYTVRLDGPEGRLVKVLAANVEEGGAS